MRPQLYAHPFSSYCQKVLTALYENATPFEYCTLGPDQPAHESRLTELWPLRKFPVLADRGNTILESTTIIEYLDVAHPGRTRFMPVDPRAAIEVRMMDRIFDNYVMGPMQKIVLNQIRPEANRDPYGVDEARAMLDKTYEWLDRRLGAGTWAAGAEFTLADCAAAPSLFYADWAHEIAANFENLRAYRQRLLQRPSFARAVDEARPFRPYFPLGAPDRD